MSSNVLLHQFDQVNPIVDDVRNRGDSAVIELVAFVYIVSLSCFNSSGLLQLYSYVIRNLPLSCMLLYPVLCSYTARFDKVVLDSIVEHVADLPDPKVGGFSQPN